MPIRAPSGSSGHAVLAEPCARDLRQSFRDFGKAADVFGVDSTEIPAVVIDSDPGDVLIWDYRLIHASFNGLDRRRFFSVNFRERAAQRAPDPVRRPRWLELTATSEDRNSTVDNVVMVPVPEELEEQVRFLRHLAGDGRDARRLERGRGRRALRAARRRPDRSRDRRRSAPSTTNPSPSPGPPRQRG